MSATEAFENAARCIARAEDLGIHEQLVKTALDAGKAWIELGAALVVSEMAAR
jgi:hypothetical protein